MNASARSVTISAGNVQLQGDLVLPEHASGIIIFAHGSGSSRHSPRNKLVAEALQHAGLATLLFDLLTAEEEYAERYTAQLRFDIALLTQRLIRVTDWVRSQPDLERLPIGYFGASTGAAAALLAAAERPNVVHAVVSRGGRPDLGLHGLAGVQAPTLLLVGERDHDVLSLNRVALEQLQCEKQLITIPGATHLFEERGALEHVATLARDWLTQHLSQHLATAQ